MKIHILTLFPQAFPGTLGVSLIGKAIQSKLAQIYIHDLKEFTDQIDDTPYGGGCGMVIRCETVDNAICQLNLENSYKIFTSPRGSVFKQEKAAFLSKLSEEILILCGRYEGVDQRVLDKWSFNYISIGDYVLCGGEVAASVIIEAAVRLLPGVVGKEESVENESFSDCLLEHDQFTKPAVWQDMCVPKELLDGDHGKIQALRAAQSKLLTKEKRPDLWQKYEEMYNKD